MLPCRTLRRLPGPTAHGSELGMGHSSWSRARLWLRQIRDCRLQLSAHWACYVWLRFRLGSGPGIPNGHVSDNYVRRDVRRVPQRMRTVRTAKWDGYRDGVNFQLLILIRTELSKSSDFGHMFSWMRKSRDGHKNGQQLPDSVSVSCRYRANKRQPRQGNWPGQRSHTRSGRPTGASGSPGTLPRGRPLAQSRVRMVQIAQHH